MIEQNNLNIKRNPPKECKGLTFSECELTLLRIAKDSAEKKIGFKKIKDPQNIKMLQILEKFLQSKQLICYGGTAINNLLPKYDQFYNDYSFPDFDVFSLNPMDDAKELVNIFILNGYLESSAKSAQHFGTYKVFVNYIPIVDITELSNNVWNLLFRDKITIKGIHYAPPNFLRMNMYNELSKPMGSLERWEKVLKRLILLNKHYPIISNIKCSNELSSSLSLSNNMDVSNDLKIYLYNLIKKILIDKDVVFFGGFAMNLFSHYSTNKNNYLIQNDFYVLSTTPHELSQTIKKMINNHNIQNIKINEYSEIPDLINIHYEITYNNSTLCFIFFPSGCHSYNEYSISNNKHIKIASIDTILSFYLAFLYIDRPYFQSMKTNLICMAQFIFNLQQQNRLNQNGLLKRFSTKCYGTESTIEDLKNLKSQMFNLFKNKQKNTEYKKWFFNYEPSFKIINKKYTLNNKIKTSKKQSKKKKQLNQTKSVKNTKQLTGTLKKSTKKSKSI